MNMAATNKPHLSVSGIDVGYGHVNVLRSVSLDIERGSIVALVGSNGAGKTTLLRAISGLLKPTGGDIRFNDVSVAGTTAAKIVDRGLLHVAEGRRLFKRLSVADNLQLGLWGTKLSPAATEERYQHVYELFPILRDRLGELAGVLSGGQQQMLAIAQAIIRRPELLMLDEPSLGLSPLLVDQVLDVVQRLRREGTTILLIEQMVERALEISDEVYVMLNGQIIGNGTPDEVREQDLIDRAYLGAGGHP